MTDYTNSALYATSPDAMADMEMNLERTPTKVYVVLIHCHPDLLDECFHDKTIIDSVHRTKDVAISRAQALEIQQLERELKYIREDPKHGPRLYSRYVVRPFNVED